MKHVATTLQCAGIAGLAAAGALVFLPLGIAIAGVGLLALGIAAERG